MLTIQSKAHLPNLLQLYFADFRQWQACELWHAVRTSFLISRTKSCTESCVFWARNAWHEEKDDASLRGCEGGAAVWQMYSANLHQMQSPAVCMCVCVCVYTMDPHLLACSSLMRITVVSCSDASLFQEISRKLSGNVPGNFPGTFPGKCPEISCECFRTFSRNVPK